MYNFKDLVHIIKELRSEHGCSWDREQTHISLKTHLIEESYEVIDAIDDKDDQALKEELGDVLLQVLLHSTIAEEEKAFTIEDVVDYLAEKMIRRHPHVFSQKSQKTPSEVEVSWEHIKRQESGERTLKEEMMHVPKSLPSLIRAEKVQKKAKKVGFEFEHTNDTLDKVYEELEELKVEIEQCDKQKIEEEFGDLLFSLVNLSRFLGLNAENSLTKAIEKFINRLGSIENLANTRGLELSSMTLKQLDQLWTEIKKKQF